MKIFIIVCLTAVVALTIGVPAPAISAEDAVWQKVVEAAKKEGIVNVASSSFSGKAGVEISEAFKGKYGISLELITGRPPQLVEKVKMEQKSKSYIMDTFDASGAYLPTLNKEGYLESVAEALPVLKEKDKFVYFPKEDTEGQFLAVVRLHHGLWLNTNLVKPEQEPKSHYDLLDPKWNGKMLLVNPLYNSGPESQLVVLVNAKVVGQDDFVKLYKNGTLAGVGGAREAMDRLVRGEFAISGAIGGATGMRAFLAGAPVKPLDLKEGAVFRMVRVAALKNRPHPNATKVFINWLFSKEGQLVVSKAVGMEGVRNDIPPVMPFRFTGPPLPETYELMLLAEKRYSEQYLSKLLGIKR